MTKLPCSECKGQCCSAPAFSKREFKTVRKKYGVPKGTEILAIQSGISPMRKDGMCAYLSDEGACTVYDLRPRVCRLYGEIPDLPCQYLYPDKAKEKVDELMKRLVGKI